MASHPRERARAALQKAAGLARIGLSEEEARSLAPQFGAILEALRPTGAEPVDRTSETGESPTFNGRPPTPGRTRPDREREPLGRARLLPLAPDTSGDSYRVPRSGGGPR